MQDNANFSSLSRLLVTAGSFVIVVAGMRVASPILVPFLLACFIVIICTPALYWLTEKKVPRSVAVVFLIVAILIFGFLLALVLGTTLNNFLNSLPEYEVLIRERMATIVAFIERFDLKISSDLLTRYINPENMLQMAANIFTRLSNVLTNIFLILLTVVFLLLEIAGARDKMYAAFKMPEDSISHLNTFIASVNRYLSIKTLLSLATGLLIYVFLEIVGVDYPLLWGCLAFLFNFVPNIGSIMAAIPPVILAYIQMGIVPTLVTIGGYLVVNTIIGNLIEPRLLGKRLGLSTLVVFLSLVFWGWILGPVGMLLSVPLTMVVKIFLENNSDTKWIAILLGP
ncbi:MAG: AI-2E family transporter [Desulfohalobiaceae bacterium]|nr:AI-2E family transporter [Desulfohalobiaceae bacterium]